MSKTFNSLESLKSSLVDALCVGFDEPYIVDDESADFLANDIWEFTHHGLKALREVIDPDEKEFALKCLQLPFSTQDYQIYTYGFGNDAHFIIFNFSWI